MVRDYALDYIQGVPNLRISVPDAAPGCVICKARTARYYPRLRKEQPQTSAVFQYTCRFDNHRYEIFSFFCRVVYGDTKHNLA